MEIVWTENILRLMRASGFRGIARAEMVTLTCETRADMHEALKAIDIAWQFAMPGSYLVDKVLREVLHGIQVLPGQRVNISNFTLALT